MSTPLTRALAAGAVGVLLVSALSVAQMPPGHPGNRTNPGQETTPKPTQDEEPLPLVAPRAEDVASADAIIQAYYASISGPKGQERDWDRFRSLFLPKAELMSVQQMHQNTKIISLRPEDYMHLNDTYFTKGGYFESEIHREIRAYGIVAQVFSTYESRRTPEEPAYSRGINAFQLLYDGNRWWIASATWDREQPHNPIPAEFLPPE
jgi:hypothetical protein